MKKTVMAMILSLLSSWALALDINQASSAELQGLKGIGAKTAEMIVEARSSKAFSDWDDLQTRIKGLGPGKAAALSKQGLTIDGKGFKNRGQTKAKSQAKEKAQDKAEKAMTDDEAQDKAKKPKGKDKAPSKAAKAPKPAE